jgi:glycosyltransferase involved in cell wall biosynthesis
MTQNATSPHMTVIIPTRERADVLEKSLKTCTTQNYDNLTILVSDNCSGDRTKEVVLSANDERVQYLRADQRLSMSHNYEFALSHVSEGWVTIIGDDDGLLPGSIARVIDIIATTGVDAIRSDNCLYRWPGLLGSGFGRLAIPLKSGAEVRNSGHWLSAVMAGRALYPNLPMLYSGGFARVSKLLEIKAKSGKFYYSCIPDVYSAIAIASVIKEYIYSYEPFAIDGVSVHSTGTSIVQGGPSGPAKQFLMEDNIPLHQDIPTAPDGSVPRVHQAWIYESYLQSRFLRDGLNECSHEQQLKVVLASPACDSAAEEWGKIFADNHRLNFNEILKRAKRQRRRIALVENSRRLYRALHTHYVGDASTPVQDVYEASLVAGNVRHQLPGPIETVRNLAAKTWTKWGDRRRDVATAPR